MKSLNIKYTIRLSLLLLLCLTARLNAAAQSADSSSETAFESDGLLYTLFEVTDDSEETIEYEARLIGASEEIRMITVPASVTYENRAYKVTEIAEEAFMGNRKLEKFKTGLNVTKIGDRAFKDCRYLSEIVFDSVREIGEESFCGCFSLERIDLPDSVSQIHAGAFRECMALQTCRLPSQLVEIPDNMFYNCIKLKDIKFPEALKSIGSFSFYNCYSLKKIDLSFLSFSVDFGSYCFKNCLSIEDVKLPEMSWLSGGCFYNCVSLKSINIPGVILGIPSFCFYGCKSLTQISIPENAEFIGEQTFWGTSITQIIIPENLLWIYDGSLYNDTLLEVKVLKHKPPYRGNDDSFYIPPFSPVTLNYGVLYVPKGSLSLYQRHEMWSDFTNIIEMDGDDDNSAGITDISENSEFRIISIDGKIMMTTSDKEVLNTLPEGIYLINGKKIYLKNF